MLRTRQRTLEGGCSYKGIGIHTGQQVTVSFKPAPPDHGIVFVRIDLPDAPKVPASIDHVALSDDNTRRTTLSYKGVQIHTVEHVLAALAGLGIDNAVVELDADEPAEPTDGSCDSFVDILTDAGIVQQDAQLQYLEIVEPVTFDDGNVHIAASPHDGFRLSFTIDYENRTIGTQYASFEIAAERCRGSQEERSHQGRQPRERYRRREARHRQPERSQVSGRVCPSQDPRSPG